jgi:hypothetical protein
MSSLYFAGDNSHYLSLPDNNALHFGNNNFEISWDQKIDNLSGVKRVFSLGHYSSAEIAVSIEGSTIYYWAKSGWRINASISAYNDTWCNIKIVRSSGTTTMSISSDGVSYTTLGSFSDSFNYNNSNAYSTLYIGNEDLPSYNYPYKGYLNNFKWINNGTTVLNLSGSSFGGSLGGTVVNTGPVLTNGPASCFNEGTQILCLNGEQETYMPIEKILAGTLVKTYKHGAKAVKYIGKGSMRNDVENPKSCMFKMTKTANMTDDLILTGGHAILVDEAPKGLQFKIEDKFFSFVENDKSFEKIENAELYTYYNFCFENDDDENARYGVWANGVLCETPSEKQFVEHQYSAIL